MSHGFVATTAFVYMPTAGKAPAPPGSWRAHDEEAAHKYTARRSSAGVRRNLVEKRGSFVDERSISAASEENREAWRTASKLMRGANTAVKQLDGPAWVAGLALLQQPAVPELLWSDLGGSGFTPNLDTMTKMGEGEFCTVHVTLAEGADRAVKTLRRSREGGEVACADLLRELTVLSRARHRNVIRLKAHGQRPSLVDPGRLGSVPFGCLELVEPLAKQLPPEDPGNVMPWVRAQGVKRWPVQRGLDVALQIARALRYCHDEYMPGYRLLHRDLKPTNIG